MKTMAVAEMMSTNPITCDCDDSIVEISKILKKYAISSIVILDKDEVSGILTVDDIVRRVVASGKNPAKTMARDVMIKDIISVEPQTPLEKVIETLNSHSISQVPVMTGKKLNGFVTMKDILCLEPTLFDLFSKRLEEQQRERHKFIQSYVDIDNLDLE